MLKIGSYLLVVVISSIVTLVITRQTAPTPPWSAEEALAESFEWSDDVLVRMETVFESGLAAYAPRQERCGIEDRFMAFQTELVTQYGTFMDQRMLMHDELQLAYLVAGGDLDALRQVPAYDEMVLFFANMERHLEDVSAIPCGEF